MAHEDCLTTDLKKWESTFFTKGDDGIIEIEEVSNELVGRHLLTGADLKNIVCDGKKISFSRVDTAKGEEVFYEDGKITKSGTKVKIKGKFRTVSLLADSGGSRYEKDEKTNKEDKKMKADANNGGDWEAEKPVA